MPIKKALGLRKPEKEEQVKVKISRRKIIRIRAEIIEILKQKINIENQQNEKLVL